MNEGPDRPVVHFEAAASKLRHKGAQGEVSLRDSPPKKDGMLTNKNARPVAAHLPRSRASGRLKTLRPFHAARWADVQYLSHKAHALARLNPRNSPLAQIHRIGLAISERPPIQIPRLNQKLDPLGIPADSAPSHPALDVEPQ
jgi:hypothetical protein